jgi:hypothetical protein
MKKQKQIEKQTITSIIFTFNPYDLEGTVENAIKFLQEKFQPNDRLDYYNEYSVYRDRLETDKEYVSRMHAEEQALAKQKKSKENKELRDRKEYARLKKKFEK